MTKSLATNKKKKFFPIQTVKHGGPKSKQKWFLFRFFKCTLVTGEVSLSDVAGIGVFESKYYQYISLSSAHKKIFQRDHGENPSMLTHFWLNYFMESTLCHVKM